MNSLEFVIDKCSTCNQCNLWDNIAIRKVVVTPIIVCLSIFVKFVENDNYKKCIAYNMFSSIFIIIACKQNYSTVLYTLYNQIKKIYWQNILQ